MCMYKVGYRGYRGLLMQRPSTKDTNSLGGAPTQAWLWQNQPGMVCEKPYSVQPKRKVSWEKRCTMGLHKWCWHYAPLYAGPASGPSRSQKTPSGPGSAFCFSTSRSCVVSQTSILSDKMNFLSNLRTAPNPQSQVPNLSIFPSYTFVIADTEMILARRVQALGWCLSHKDSAKSKDPGELFEIATNDKFVFHFR